MPYIYGENWTEEEVEDYAREMNTPKLNPFKLGEKFWKVANNFDALERMRKIIEEACKKNPKGLPF